MSLHADKTVSVLRRAIQDVLGRGLHDPRIQGMISVTRVDLSSDFAHATVFVSISPQDHETLTMHGLRAAQSHVRQRVAGRISMRRMPELNFKLDRSLKNEARVLQALREDEEQLRTLRERAAESAPFEPAPHDPQVNEDDS